MTEDARPDANPFLGFAAATMAEIMALHEALGRHTNGDVELARAQLAAWREELEEHDKESGDFVVKEGNEDNDTTAD